MKRTLTVITCARAKKKFGSAPRPYGYTLAIYPPEEHLIEGHDVEGIGWVPAKPPYKVICHWQGWYKYKSLAENRARELNNV